MNRKRFVIIFLILLCLFPPLCAARDVSDIIGDTFEEISGRGLLIRTNPSSVKVFIDGAERGLSPISFDSLAPGEHQIRLTKDGYKDREFNIILFNTSRLVVSIEMKERRGDVLVSVNKAHGSPEQLPFKPEIFSGASGAQSSEALSPGNTTLLNLPEGFRTIRARAFGWEDASVTVLIEENKTASADIIMRPAELKLKNASASRKRFNPKMSGSMGVIVFRFEASAPGLGTFSVFDKDGNCVHQENLYPFASWGQSVTWNGRDSFGNLLPEGIYTVQIEASAPQIFSHNEGSAKISLETEINYSINIFPLSTESVVSGLTFSPLPSTLPGGSYQFEACLIFKDFHLPSANAPEDGVFSGLPFKISMRAAPVNRLELTAVFNINPLSENQTGWGVSGSVKFNFLNGGGKIPLAMSAAASYSWAGENGESPLSPGRGAGFYMPFSLELANFSLVLCPAAFWRGPEGFIPELLISAAVLYKGGWLNAGISARNEYDFSDNAKEPRILAGAQIYFFPPPSIFYFSFQAGMWKRGQYNGIYGGLSLGIIY